MYIKKLELVNFQVIKEFSADFTGNVYFITGDNELGKSTLLKAIGALLTGKRDEVLRNGEDKGFAEMVVGDDGEEYNVKLSFTKANPRGTLTITSKSTGMATNNVTALQKLFGYQDYDAVEFSRWSETTEGRRKQIEVVKNLLPEQVRKRIEEIDANVAELKQERTNVNRDIKTFATICENAKKNLADGDEEKYNATIDVADLMQAQAEQAQLIEKAKTIKATLAQRVEQLNAIPEKIKMWENAKAKAKEEYDNAIAEALAKFQATNIDIEKNLDEVAQEERELTARKANCEMWLKQYEESDHNEDIAAKIQQAMAHNQKVAIVADYKAKRDQLTAVEDSAKELAEKIDAMTQERVELINKSELPISGLSFTDDGLELNGVAFVPGKVSDSQIMEVATKLIIASNPTVKVFRIARGESLGEKRLREIVDIARKNGFQGFIEQVQRGQMEMEVEEYTEV